MVGIGRAIVNAPYNILKGFLEWTFAEPAPRKPKKEIGDDVYGDVDESDEDLKKEIMEEKKK